MTETNTHTTSARGARPMTRKGFRNVRLERQRQMEDAPLLASLLQARPIRTMAEMSAEELAVLQGKVERWVREGTCRFSGLPLSPEAIANL